MRILIEEYRYNVADVKDILQGIDALENVEGRVSIHYVGYYYTAEGLRIHSSEGATEGCRG